MARGRAKARRQGEPGKAPRADAAANAAQKETPLFCFRHADRTSGEEWKFKAAPDHAPALVEFLCQMGELTWSEIEAQRIGAHKKHHSHPLSRLPTKSQKDFARLVFQGQPLDETFGDDFFRFHLGGPKRLWGFRAGRVFHVIWWDPKHKVYPTEKRHT